MNLFNDFLNTISDTEVTTTSAIFKLMLSLLLGGIVGFERKRKGQVAGARTFALISMGATLAMIISIYIPQVYWGLKNGDPGRVAAQVITGVGFLGAGSDHSCRYLDGGGFGFGGRCRSLCYCDYFDHIDIVHIGEFGTI